MSMKHTPGPWKQIDRIVVYDQEYLTWIANVSVGGESGETQIANARLIAAAPDLLEALQYALPSLGFEEAEKARAAIRKALGEES